VGSFCRLLFASLAAVLLAAPANASPAMDWSGVRIGATIDLTLGSHTDSHAGVPPGPSANGDYSFSRSMEGFLAGPTVGYFFQQGRFVEGLEFDAGYGNVGGSNRINGVAHQDGSGASPSNFLLLRDHVDMMVTLRGTLGYAVSRHFLPYLTGGWMYHHGQYRGQFHDSVPEDFTSHDGGDRNGWTIGAGLACQFQRDWVVKADYLYYDVGRHPLLSNTIGTSQSQFLFGGTGALVRLGLTWRVP